MLCSPSDRLILLVPRVAVQALLTNSNVAPMTSLLCHGNAWDRRKADIRPGTSCCISPVYGRLRTDEAHNLIMPSKALRLPMQSLHWPCGYPFQLVRRSEPYQWFRQGLKLGFPAGRHRCPLSLRQTEYKDWATEHIHLRFESTIDR